MVITLEILSWSRLRLLLLFTTGNDDAAIIYGGQVKRITWPRFVLYFSSATLACAETFLCLLVVNFFVVVSVFSLSLSGAFGHYAPPDVYTRS
jgi:hypothetical protein